jgi:hypothetical protein
MSKEVHSDTYTYRRSYLCIEDTTGEKQFQALSCADTHYKPDNQYDNIEKK